MKDLRKGVPFVRLNDHVHVVGHYAPSQQPIALPLIVPKRAGNEFGNIVTP